MSFSHCSLGNGATTSGLYPTAELQDIVAGAMQPMLSPPRLGL